MAKRMEPLICLVFMTVSLWLVRSIATLGAGSRGRYRRQPRLDVRINERLCRIRLTNAQAASWQQPAPILQVPGERTSTGKGDRDGCNSDSKFTQRQNTPVEVRRGPHGRRDLRTYFRTRRQR